jgi:hypothetical protein
MRFGGAQKTKIDVTLGAMIIFCIILEITTWTSLATELLAARSFEATFQEMQLIVNTIASSIGAFKTG